MSVSRGGRWGLFPVGAGLFPLRTSPQGLRGISQQQSRFRSWPPLAVGVFGQDHELWTLSRGDAPSSGLTGTRQRFLDYDRGPCRAAMQTPPFNPDDDRRILAAVIESSDDAIIAKNL